MIICHPLKLIFIKTKKVGGTSFEIALSSFCGPDCVITPISPQDEVTRASLGYRGPQNHEHPSWPDGSRSAARFHNHMPASEVRRHVPDEIWRTYRKITIWRDPFDAAISRFYWEGGPRRWTDFGDFVERNAALLTENVRIAPLTGPSALDRYLRYESLEQDIRSLGIEGLWERFEPLKAKGDLRPALGTSPAEIYQRHPEAARIVADVCREEIRHFGYRPPSPPPPVLTTTRTEPDYYFTLTAGRTGTAWLAGFLRANLGVDAIHEPLGIRDFGTRMPDIRTMRSFNDLGFNEDVARFWRRKLASLPATSFAETNHTLGKCGLIEALAESDLAQRVKIIVLTRDLAAQCASYVARDDFLNVTIYWQWYLDPLYENRIINAEPFLRVPHVGPAFWYCCEMATRQAYYRQLYGTRLTFVPATLEDVTTEDGARDFLERLGAPRPTPVLPQRTNAGDARIATELRERIRTLVHSSPFDPDALASRYIESGRRLHAPSSHAAGMRLAG